jgi:cytochrome c biogenesis protein CcdA/thiol-disulfide isomerase/thioredoxin
MFLLFGAFIAGLLTVLAPCVLPLLPVIIGGSLTVTEKQKPDRLRPIIITTSLAVSLIVFTLLLKATTLLIHVPPGYYTDISGGILILLGAALLFPQAYESILIRLNVQAKSQQLLGRSASRRERYLGPVITGAALGPVFSSCSPVYAYILATILPANFTEAIFYMISYILGLSCMLLLIGHLGQRFITRIRFAIDPRGIFQRTVAALFILVGILIFTGGNVRLQTYVSEHTPFDFDGLSAKLLPQGNKPTSNGLYNVAPYAAPQFSGLTNWINSPPLTTRQLKGKVVLVDFWTYSCINCLRSLPHLESWYQTYHSDGFVIVGVEAPEFSFEQVASNVDAAVKSDGIRYPVASDNQLSTWANYNNQYWPADYLISKQGKVVRVQYGEGGYTQMEQAIRQLLKQDGGMVNPKYASVQGNNVPITANQSPETYFGIARASDYAGTSTFAVGTLNFTELAANQLPENGWALGGTWQIEGKDIIARANATLSFHFAAKDVYVVGGASKPSTVGVTLNGQPISQTGDAGADVHNSQLTMKLPTLYRLVNLPAFSSNDIVELQVPAGVSLNTFTFGS